MNLVSAKKHKFVGSNVQHMSVAAVGSGRSEFFMCYTCLTFDRQAVGDLRGLASNRVVCDACVQSSVFVNHLLNGVRVCFDVCQSFVKHPGVVGNGDGFGVACERQLVVHLNGVFTIQRRWLRTVCRSNREKKLYHQDEPNYLLLCFKMLS